MVSQLEAVLDAIRSVSKHFLFSAIIVELLILWCLQKWRSKTESLVSLACYGLGTVPYHLFAAAIQLQIMMWFYDHARIFTLGNEWYVWVVAFVCFDLMWWLVHFAAHKIRFLWCIHGAHHTPTEMNLSVSIRGSLFDFFQYIHLMIWLPILGFHPFMVFSVNILARLYGVFTHMNKDGIKNTPVLDKFLVTPSLHRVHHAKNPIYIDTNYANMFSFWDSVFGTRQLEVQGTEPVFGLTDRESVRVNPKRVLSTQFGLWQSLFADMRSTPKWADKVKYLFMPPGWHPRLESSPRVDPSSATPI